MRLGGHASSKRTSKYRVVVCLKIIGPIWEDFDSLALAYEFAASLESEYERSVENIKITTAS